MKICQLINKTLHDRLWRPSGGLPVQISVSAASFSGSCSWNSRKKNLSQYEMVNQEEYSLLVRSVVSSKLCPQTPTSLAEEDGQLYGPIVKSKHVKGKLSGRVLRNAFPLMSHSKVFNHSPEPSLVTPLKIGLHKDPSKLEMVSVTRILQETMPENQAFYLQRWRKKMIDELGENGFENYTRSMFRQGKLFHAALEEIFMPTESQEADEEEVQISGYIESVQHVLKDIGHAYAIESAVQHHSLNYVGLVDCVAEYRGNLCVIDWKTSEKQKPSLRNTFDSPLQVAAYMGAINNDDKYGFTVENGLIVIAYKDGSPAHPHYMNTEVSREHWTKWLFRLEEYMDKKDKIIVKS
ncbi:mitochondrial genome maintenance exonuclease 1 [Erpetoichthys calabaricus]|uniref:Mitochondrial genome maintenance exonuclease 1 n=1 Tax=Erpetoichthys calabaricus TaxID=27687 RepID=A0A8C4T589_ERPCA|nr:mitochondrial genome maintenance exonuclease 1 [Erpetoichthys calabaricus]